eukprot:719904-Rhodomonas_salina.1
MGMERITSILQVCSVPRNQIQRRAISVQRVPETRLLRFDFGVSMPNSMELSPCGAMSTNLGTDEAYKQGTMSTNLGTDEAC